MKRCPTVQVATADIHGVGRVRDQPKRLLDLRAIGVNHRERDMTARRSGTIRWKALAHGVDREGTRGLQIVAAERFLRGRREHGIAQPGGDL